MFAPTLESQLITSLQQGLAILGPLTAAEIAPLWWPGRALLTVQRTLRQLSQAGHLVAAVQAAVIDGRSRRTTTHYRAPAALDTVPLRSPLRETLLGLLTAAQTTLPNLLGMAVAAFDAAALRVVVLRRSRTVPAPAPAWPCWLDPTTPRQPDTGDRTYLLIPDAPEASHTTHCAQAAVYAPLCTPSGWPAAFSPPIPLLIATTPMRVAAFRTAWCATAVPRFLITSTAALATDGWAHARWQEVEGLGWRDRILFEGWLPDRHYPANDTRWDPQEYWQRGPP
jgi:hypothetical protein